jgi:iron complex transport system substrate-binding protein
VVLAFFCTVAAAQEAHQRIVSVGGAVTEIVYALGEGQRLVARDTTSNHPAQVLDLPNVGYIRRLSPEGILSVNPDLILTEQGAGPPEAVALLQEADLPFVTVPDGYTPQAIQAKIMAVATALGVEAKGHKLAADVQRDLTAALAEVTDLSDKKVMFILSMAGGRIMAAGANTSAQGIIQLAGARNAFEGFEGFKPVTDEAVSQTDADVILLMTREGDLAITDEMLFSHPAILATPAGQSRSVVRMDGMLMLGFSVRTPQAVRALSQALAQIRS